jgi:hypothetical protein
MSWFSNLFRSKTEAPPPSLDDAPAKPTYADIDLAVLHILNPQFRANSVGVEIGSVNRELITKEFALIDKYRAWLKTQIDPCIISAYEHWLDFFENNAKEADRAITDGARQKWTEDCLRRHEEYSRIHKFSDSLPRPE